MKKNKKHIIMKYLLIVFFAFYSSDIKAQTTVNFNINTNQDRKDISPYIYGVNYQNYTFAKSRRQSGNRYTGYNWENNASNAGSDWFHSNDNHLPMIMEIPFENSEDPGIVLTAFHDTSLYYDAYTLLTLQMAAYVARDKNGEVYEGQVAPSERWREVVNEKGSAFSLSPDTSDAFVYIDEELNFLIDMYGTSALPTGIQAYSLDNEPALWPFTHPRIHPENVTVQELIDKSVALAETIKTMDSNAEVFGPVLYGFSAYLNLQDAPDWSTYSGTYSRFTDAYLDLMRQASETAGYRLIDVFDIHWYPEPAGVYSEDTTQFVAEERMACVRSLWDSSYVENSWIGEWYSPVAVIPTVQNSIDTYNPGTKLAITEYDYNAAEHISGGLAQVDALGVFGKYSVYFASKWGLVNQFVKSAYNLYLNYDETGSEFGDISVFSSTDNIDISSVYASYPSDDTTKLHIIVINKNYDNSMDANFVINSLQNYNYCEAYAFFRSDTSISLSNSFNFSNNQFNTDIPPLSAYHFVISAVPVNISNLNINNLIKVYPNLTTGIITVKGKNIQSVEVINISGQTVYIIKNKSEKITVNLSNLRKGVYFVKVTTNKGTVVEKIVLE